MPLQIFTVQEVRPQTLGGWSQKSRWVICSTIPLFTHWPGLCYRHRIRPPCAGRGGMHLGRGSPLGTLMSGDHCWLRNWPFFGSLCCFGATMLLPVPIPSWCMWATALLSLPHYKDHIQAQGGWQVIAEPAPFCWDWVVWKGLQVLLPTKNWHLPSASTRIKSQDAVTADLQHPWKDFRVEIWNEALCLGRNWQNKSSASYFQEMVLWAQSLRIEKSTKIINADICSSRKQQPSAKCVLDCMYSPFTKITRILTFPHTSLEKFLRALWDAVSQVIAHILPQIKLSSQLSCCAFYCCCWHPALAGVPEHKGSEWGLG